MEIEFIRKRSFRKQDRIKEVLARRGERAGLVHVFSAMEPCSTQARARQIDEPILAWNMAQRIPNSGRLFDPAN